MPRDFIELPFTVLVDSREGIPYRFDRFKADARDNYAPLVVRTKRVTLTTGDYTIEGLEDRFTIERKSMEDAYQTFTHARDRFKSELVRMSLMDFACVQIECEESMLYKFIEQETNGSMKSIYRSIRYWPIDYGVHFLFASSRDMAERNALRMMQRFWEKRDE